jgi:hypothetical protein
LYSSVFAKDRIDVKLWCLSCQILTPKEIGRLVTVSQAFEQVNKREKQVLGPGKVIQGKGPGRVLRDEPSKLTVAKAQELKSAAKEKEACEMK